MYRILLRRPSLTFRHRRSQNVFISTIATSVWSFGDNSQSALGLQSPPYEAFEPTRVPSLPPDVRSVSAGHYHSLAVTYSGELWAWGRNDEGQLGRGISSPRDTWSHPQRVEGLDQVRVQSAFASGVVSAAIGDDGSLWVWGKSKRGQLGLGRGLTQTVKPTKVVGLVGKEIAKISFGWGHALAQTRDGELLGWGFCAEGRLGQMGEALEIPSLKSPRSSESGISQNFHSVMENIEKEIYIELEKEINMPIIWEPLTIQELKGIKASDIACGLDHSLILCGDNTLLSSGNNTYGQLGRSGDGSRLLPIEMSFQPTSVSAGLGHSLALCNNSSGNVELASWGWNWGSQLGRNGKEDLPAIVEKLNNEVLVSVSGGRAHSIALTSNGTVWTWGSGRNGRLGLGSSADEAEPIVVECLDDMKVLQAVAGFDHNLLVVAD